MPSAHLRESKPCIKNLKGTAKQNLGSGFEGSIDFWRVLVHFWAFITGTDSFRGGGLYPEGPLNTPTKDPFWI